MGDCSDASEMNIHNSAYIEWKIQPLSFIVIPCQDIDIAQKAQAFNISSITF